MRWLTLAILLLLASVASAHGSVQERIDDLDRRLAIQPDDPELLAERGALYALDEQWAAAVRDYEDALDADPTLPGLEHRLAHAAYQTGDAQRALELSARVLAREPRHADAHLVRARAHLALGHHAEAVADFARSIQLSETPSPRSYRELAKAQAAWGADHVDEALASLRDGMQRLGPLVSLVETAIELEEARDAHAAALALVDLLPPLVKDSPLWRLKRAELLRRAGRLGDSDAALRGALAALDALPQSRQATPAMTDLRQQIQDERKTLDTLKREQAAAALESDRRRLEWPLLALAALMLAAALWYVRSRRSKRSGAPRSA
jgi:tetratricopeptide (TPR) repeat protein